MDPVREALARGSEEGGWQGMVRAWISLMIRAATRGTLGRSYPIAVYLPMLGETEEAMTWLERAYEERDPAATLHEGRPALRPPSAPTPASRTCSDASGSRRASLRCSPGSRTSRWKARQLVLKAEIRYQDLLPPGFDAQKELREIRQGSEALDGLAGASSARSATRTRGRVPIARVRGREMPQGREKSLEFRA